MTQSPKKPTTTQKMMAPTKSIDPLIDLGMLMISISVNFFGKVAARLIKPAKIETA